jgi:hypothetical protein
MSANQGDFAGQQVNNVNMPSPQVYAQWAQLSIQLSHYNVVIAIDMPTFMHPGTTLINNSSSKLHVSLRCRSSFLNLTFMSLRMATGGTVPTFIRDGNAPRMFLGPLALLQRQQGFQLPAVGQYPQRRSSTSPLNSRPSHRWWCSTLHAVVLKAMPSLVVLKVKLSQVAFNLKPSSLVLQTPHLALVASRPMLVNLLALATLGSCSVNTMVTTQPRPLIRSLPTTKSVSDL